jgi:hypothetical protein
MSLRISYSSSNTFQGCNRRFYYRKVKEVTPDPDYEENTTALRLGKAFHQVLEDAFHRKDKLSGAIFQKSFNDNDILSDTERSHIRAMVHRYLVLHQRSGLSVVAVELEIGNDKYLGYIDAIMSDKNGNWWIVDLKTASRLNESLLSRLSRDPQLNVYSYFVPKIAETLKLNESQFMGVRYRVTTKPTIKLNKKESVTEFVKRCYERIESYDIGVPADELTPELVYSQMMNLLSKMNNLEFMKEEEIPQNFTYCESYFRPCPYWSRCYGNTYTQAADQHKIYSSEDIVDLTQADELDLL